MKYDIDKTVRDWLDNLVLSNCTITLYKKTINYWFRYLSANNIDKYYPKRSDVIKYMNYMVKAGKSPFSVNNYLSSVRSYYSFLESEKIYSNIASGVNIRVNYKTHRRGHLTPEEVTKLLDFKTDTLNAMRDYIIITLMVVLGLRRSEVHNINDEDIKAKGTQNILYLLRKGKTTKQPFVNLDSELIKLINDYQNKRGYSECKQLFQDHEHKNKSLNVLSITRIVNNRLKTAGLKRTDITAHSLRHTAAVNASKNGATDYELQKFLGHSNIESVRPYLMSLEDEKMLNNPCIKKNYKSFNIGIKTH